MRLHHEHLVRLDLQPHARGQSRLAFGRLAAVQDTPGVLHDRFVAPRAIVLPREIGRNGIEVGPKKKEVMASRGVLVAHAACFDVGRAG